MKLYLEKYYLLLIDSEELSVADSGLTHNPSSCVFFVVLSTKTGNLRHFRTGTYFDRIKIDFFAGS